MDEAEYQINDLEHKKARNNQSKQEEKRSTHSPQKHTVCNLWDNFKHSNICIIGVPEGEEKSKKLDIHLKK